MKMKVTTNNSPVKMRVNCSSKVRARVGTSIEVIDGTLYTGEYTVIPSRERQVLETERLLMNGNVTVDPIPSNYGLITWDGSTLTVS